MVGEDVTIGEVWRSIRRLENDYVSRAEIDAVKKEVERVNSELSRRAEETRSNMKAMLAMMGAIIIEGIAIVFAFLV